MPAVSGEIALKYLRLRVLSPGGKPVVRMDSLRVLALETWIRLLLRKAPWPFSAWNSSLKVGT